MVIRKLMGKIFAVFLSVLLVIGMFPMTIFATEGLVKVTTANESFTIETDPTDTIENVKAKIQDIKGYEPDEQKLFFNNQALENGNTLQDYSIDVNSEIRLISISEPTFDGKYYLISNANELYWFSDYVNNTDPSIYGKLVNNIVVNENVLDSNGQLNGSNYILWTPIGENNYRKFDGFFDGNGYTVSGLYTDGTSENQGLFGSLSGNGTIENVGVADSYISGTKYVGGVCAYNYKGQIINCYNTGTVVATGDNASVGGVAGYSYYSVENCFNTGSVTSNGSDGNIGSIVGFSYNAVINCYYLEGSAEKGIGNESGEAYSKTAAEFQNGAVAYILNGQKSDGIWYQNIDVGVQDNHPTLNSTHGKVYKITICNGAVGYSNINSDITEHNFDNGFCTVCGAYQQPSQLDGVYQITNAGELYWFAEYVNTENSAVNAELNNDIVINKNVLTDNGQLNEDAAKFKTWYPIGNEANTYKGIFDGKNNTISGLYINAQNNYQGFIGSLGTDGKIKNLGIVDSYIKGNGYIGGICGTNNSGLIENCYNTGSINGSEMIGGICSGNGGTIKNCYNSGLVTGNCAGGICGDNSNAIINCYNTGSLSGTQYIGGICGFNRQTISNCYNIGNINGNDYLGDICGNYNVLYSTITNCYYLDTSTISNNEFGEAKTAKEFASGEVCYLLNQSDPENTIWRQNIEGEENRDLYPVLDTTHSIVKKDDNGHYINHVHSYDNGFCTVCGAYQQPSQLDGVYQITNAGELYWFAEYVNTVNSAADAELVNDIVINEKVLTVDGQLNGDGSNFRMWTPIGDEYNYYTGTFDGNENAIFGLYLNNNNDYEGFIAYLGEGGLVQNLYLEDSYIRANDYVGGITGFNDDATLYNCFNFGTVTGNKYVGGVVGCTHGEITDCNNAGVITGSYAGGICGYNSKGNIFNCVNTGNVNGGEFVGGVAGFNYYIIDHCFNSGVIYGTENVGGICGDNQAFIKNCSNLFTVNGEMNVGGITGRNLYSVEKSSNFGNVSGSNNVGGITGYNSKGIKNASNLGSVNGVENVGGISGSNLMTEKNSFSYATVTGEKNVGDICGFSGEDATTANCFYLKTDAQPKNEYGIPKNEFDFKSGAVTYLLNSNNSDPIWGQTLGALDYPELNGDKVYAGYENCGSLEWSYTNTEGKLYETKPEHSYGAWTSALNGYHTRVCSVCSDLQTEKCSGGSASYFKKAVCDVCHAEYGSLLVDTTAPTGEIIVGENKWHQFLNTITFGLFFNDTQEVIIQANDDSYSHTGYTEDKAVQVSYYLYSGSEALTKDQLNELTFTNFEGLFNIEPDNQYVIYVKLVDHAGNVTYINSNGITLDKTFPVIEGIENNKTYCSAVEVTVTEDNLDTVTVNGKPVELTDGKFTVSPAEAPQTITVTDKAKNSVTYIITVNDGHTFSNYASNNDATCTENGTETSKCDFCDATDTRVAENSALGHNYGAPIWSWSEDGKTATVKFICANDETHVEEPKVTVTSKVTTNPTCTEMGTTTYTATVEFNSATYTDTKEVVDVPALGHNFKDGVCTVDGVVDENYKPETIPATGTQGNAAAFSGMFMVFALSVATTVFVKKRKAR